MSKTVLFQTIQFSISTQFSSFYLSHRYDSIRCWHFEPEWTHPPKLQHYWSHTIILFRVIPRTLVGGVLPLCRDAVRILRNYTRFKHFIVCVCVCVCVSDKTCKLLIKTLFYKSINLISLNCVKSLLKEQSYKVFYGNKDDVSQSVNIFMEIVKISEWNRAVYISLI